MPRYNEHFGSFPENLLNGVVQYNEPELSLRAVTRNTCYGWKAKGSAINICEMLRVNLLLQQLLQNLMTALMNPWYNEQNFPSPLALC